MICTHKHATPERAAACGAVDPGDVVIVVGLGGGGNREKFRQIMKALGLCRHPWTWYALQREFGPDDHPGQTEAADGRTIQIHIFCRTAFKALAIRAQQLEAAHMLAERAR